MMKYLAFLLMMSCAIPAFAQTNSEKDKPLEITADQTLEWHRNDKKYVARGDAVATQGNVSIHAETLTADYRESQTSNFDIYKMTAEDGVVITSQGNEAFGDKAVYELDTGIATMTGKALKMTAPDQTLTARDKFEYGVTEGRLSAYGDVVVIRPSDKMQADKASAFFSQNTQAGGQRKLERLEAEGNVIITTATETLRGDRGVYRADSNIAEVTGHVKITRGPNVLEGERAEINLTTNVSRMFGNQTGTTSTGRVKGVFYPSSKDGGSATPTPAPTPGPAPTPATGVRVIPETSPESVAPSIQKPSSSRLTAP